MGTNSWIVIFLLVFDLLVRISFSIRVIMRRRPVGVSLAWLFVILLVPFAGAFFYLLVGELRLGNRRAKKTAVLARPYEDWIEELGQRFEVDLDQLDGDCEPIVRLVENAGGVPALPGNRIKLLPEWESALEAIVTDIDNSTRTCHLEFYIWHNGGMADEVARALIRARQRGVLCRILVDDVGSRAFLRSSMAQEMIAEGIQIQGALPANIVRSLFVRLDLRMHRKIVVIDGQIAYTGSLNLVDPRFFKQEAGVGHWVDAMVRLEGPALEPLAVTLLADWACESGETIEELRETGNVKRCDELGDSTIQVIPSGPIVKSDWIQQILLMTIYSAKQELIMTTPYFVPDPTMLSALRSAAMSGVDVTLIVPEEVDSRLVHYASQAHMGELLEAGVRIMQFKGGLLHTKSVTVDGEFSLFGSVNLDPRSLFLMFEITLGVYDKIFTGKLRELQQRYMTASRPLDLSAWQDQGIIARFAQNVARLVGPIL